jgi:hypothetical protein
VVILEPEEVDGAFHEEAPVLTTEEAEAEEVDVVDGGVVVVLGGFVL